MRILGETARGARHERHDQSIDRSGAGSRHHPVDSDYDAARVVYNAMHDRKPRAVIQCMDSADVMAAVAAGRDSGSTWRFVVGGTAFPDSARWTAVWSSTCRR